MSTRIYTQRAPSHLLPEGKTVWHDLCSVYDFNPGDLRILRLLCEQVDLQKEAQRTLKREGVTYIDANGVQRQRPEVQVDKAASRLISSLMRQLDLENLEGAA